MENKKLFRILSLIPEELVQSYSIEYINHTDSGTPGTLYPTVSTEIPTLYELFMKYFQNHIELLSCKVFIKEDCFLEIDCLSGVLWINVEIQFPFLDTLVRTGLLGKDKPLNSIRFL
jgi:hypothetical protein